MSLQDARTVKPLKLDDQHRVQEGLTEVEAERQNSAVHQISYGNEKIALLQCKSLTEQCALFPNSKLFFLAVLGGPVKRRTLVTHFRKAVSLDLPCA